MRKSTLSHNIVKHFLFYIQEDNVHLVFILSYTKDCLSQTISCIDAVDKIRYELCNHFLNISLPVVVQLRDHKETLDKGDRLPVPHTV